jgi:outer membrane immunogenic protein
MNRLLGAAVLAAFATASHAGGPVSTEYEGTAIAPDFFTAPPGMSPARPYNWTGVYIGPNAGGGGGRTRWASTPDGTSGSVGMSGGLFGGTLGYNLQAGNSSFVLGEEVDIAWTGMRGTVPAPACAPACEIRTPWLMTARLRFGYSFDWLMPYFTAGVSVARLETNTVGTPFGREDKNNLSWTVGGGVEFVLSGPWTAKLEYLHIDLSGTNCQVACGGGPIAMNVSEDIIRAGLNLRIWNR